MMICPVRNHAERGCAGLNTAGLQHIITHAVSHPAFHVFPYMQPFVQEAADKEAAEAEVWACAAFSCRRASRWAITVQLSCASMA